MNKENPRIGNENHTDNSIASFLKRIWKDIQVFALDSKNEFITISRNITDCKRDQKALEDSERKYREIVNHAPTGIYEIDFRNQRLLSVNDAMCKGTGYSREEMLGMNPLDLLDNQSKSLFQTRMQQWLSGQEPENNVDYLIKTKDGREIRAELNVYFTFDEFGTPLGATVIAHDITDRKRAEEALLFREEQLRLALSAGRLGTYSTDFLTGETIFNDEYFYMLGYEPGEIKPGFLNIVGRIHPEDRPIILMNHAQNMERGGEFSDEYRLLLPDGTVRWMKNHGFIKHNEAGHPVHVYGVVIDTTEQKKAGILLWKKKEQALKLVDTLRQVDQNKNAFINMLSHELRNPLASIMMCLDLLDKFPADEKMAGMAREIARRQGKQLTRLVDDLLDVTRINQNKVTLKKEWVELNELIKTVILDYQLQFAENKVKLEVNLSSPLYLEVDSSRLTQVIGNLLHNAAKFTSKNDLVTVTVAPDVNTSEAVITVQDTGRGIEPNYLENLFEPFTQFEQSLDRSHGGLGLGLAVVKGMVELHGGSVEALSEGRDKGATFTIRLPLPKENVGEQEGCGSLEPILNESITVLLIDDNKDLARVICELIAFIGYKTEAAHNGIEGIAKARELRPDVVICDIGLPGMSGYEFAQLLRKDPELQDIFLIALSGYAQPEDIERSKEAGFDLHLGKPVSIETLQQVLNNLLIGSNYTVER